MCCPCPTSTSSSPCRQPIARIAFQNRTTVFAILFRTAADTIKTISADPRRFAAHVGGTAVLHTWNQKMEWHPHLHCLVPNGGFDIDTGAWKTGSPHFFAPVRVLARFFRNRFLENLARADLAFHGSVAHLADREAFETVLREARTIEWNVYAKRPFNGPEAVIRYLSRYTHRIAISDARIIAFDGDSVTMRHRKPVAKAGEKPSYGTMTLGTDAFIRRFLLHRLPRGLHRIRHFGILANGCRAKTLDAVRSSTGAASDTIDDDTDWREHQGLRPLRRPLAARSRLRPQASLSRKTRPGRRPAAPTRASHTGDSAMTGPPCLSLRCAHRRAVLRPHGAGQPPTAHRHPSSGHPTVSPRRGIPRRGANIIVPSRTTRRFGHR